MEGSAVAWAPVEFMKRAKAALLGAITVMLVRLPSCRRSSVCPERMVVRVERSGLEARAWVKFCVD